MVLKILIFHSTDGYYSAQLFSIESIQKQTHTIWYALQRA